MTRAGGVFRREGAGGMMIAMTGERLELVYGPLVLAEGRQLVARVRRADGQWLDPADPAGATWSPTIPLAGWAWEGLGGTHAAGAPAGAMDYSQFHRLRVPSTAWPDGTAVLVFIHRTGPDDPDAALPGSLVDWAGTVLWRDPPPAGVTEPPPPPPPPPAPPGGYFPPGVEPSLTR